MKKKQAGLFGKTGIIGFLALMVVGMLFADNCPSLAQTPQSGYPLKEIQMIIPFAPGGGLDLFGRTVARVLNDEKIVSKRIQVVNMPGASGAKGMAEMVQARRGNSYSLLGVALHVHITPLMMGTPHSYKNLTPIAKIFSEYLLTVVRPESPIKSLKDLEAEFRKDVGRLKIGGSAVGNGHHITIGEFARKVGSDPSKLTYVQYSGGEANAAVLGGHVDLALGSLNLMDLVEARKLRVLAINSPARLAGRFKVVPTYVEQGYDVVFPFWRGIFGPPEMPAPVVKYWNDALKKMVQTKAWKAELEKNQWSDTFESSDTFLASLNKEGEIYHSILKQLGLLKK